MPICEADPWRIQYFEGIPCPDGVNIPTEDSDAWLWYPAYKWVYNKLAIAESQNLPCAPHGLEPPSFPVFSKPIYNMKGMGAGSRVIRSSKKYKRYERPGHFWMTLLEGDHVSSDVVVVQGEPQWWRHTTGKPLEGGMFDYWTVMANPIPDVEAYCGDWLRRCLSNYTGMVNFETIGGKIIEVHLRFADQWPDLYGEGWVEALIRLYAEGIWQFNDAQRQEGFSVVLFGAHDVKYSHPPKVLVDELRHTPKVSSIQITFHEDRAPKDHSMPPGGFRLAIVNCWDLETGFKVREKLALSFWSAQSLLSHEGAESQGSKSSSNRNRKKSKIS
ncbi:hypothetical protein [Candidatus Nitronereus thalassa]|uniref:Uncharacterized protein n=1 Tax=Candidatus Nitronereus thalassa TaxID=3020898 RepID=A0ABU3K5S2_9BACT|nr:hypothetical protein [Candidatus Nitronereus thalassa]MDT7041731.1 hypothetical protein [Candidatus Nitronereus thalassa]